MKVPPGLLKTRNESLCETRKDRNTMPHDHREMPQVDLSLRCAVALLLGMIGTSDQRTRFNVTETHCEPFLF